MKATTYDRWINKKVRRISDGENGPVGQVIEPTKTRSWWRVEWAAGKRTIEPERNLILVTEQGA